MKSIDKIILECRRPFQPSEVDWKIQSAKQGADKALVVAFVDARDVAERLNSICPGQWERHHTPLIVNNTLQGVSCKLTIADDEHLRQYEDIGIGADVGEGMKGYERDIVIKTYYSDSFKRAAVSIGIATSLYELPQIWVSDPDYLYKPGDTIKGLTNAGKKHLKERYDTWVSSDPVKNKFGEIYEI